MRRLTARLQAGKLDTAQWRDAMAQAVKDLHACQYAAARGGFHNVTAAEWAELSKRVEGQLHYLNRFANQIGTGLVRVDGRAMTRAAMYAQASRGTFEQGRRAEAQGVYSEERRIRHARESCEDCIDQAGLGWQPLGTLRQIGDSACRASCLCTFAFRKGETQ
jgi:hypothetical protein